MWAYSTKRRKNPFWHAYVYNGLPRLDMLYSCHACRHTDNSLARVISYHRVREAVAGGWVQFEHIPGAENPADILTNGPQRPLLREGFKGPQMS